MTQLVRIVLAGLEFHGFHGVFDEERRFGARFVVDAELYLRPPARDRLEDSADYAAAYALIAEEVTERRYALIESLALGVAERLLAADAKLLRVRVRVHKPHAPLPGVVRDVFAEVERARDG